MEQHLSEQKCPACGAPLRFDPTSGRSVCDFCGSTFEISQEGQVGEGSDKPGMASADIPELPVYNCASCGAEIIADSVSASVQCPYCGNNIVLSEKVTGGLRPDGIIPFKIDRDKLPAAVKSFYGNKPLLPKNFFSVSSIEDVCGVYVPFWLYNCIFSGQANYEGWKDRATREGDYLVTTRSHYNVVRDVSMRFRDIPVDGSKRLDDALMDSVAPFDFSALVPFSMSYLSGFFAERFDLDSEEVRSRAEERMLSTALSIADAKAGAGYTGTNRRSHNITSNDRKIRYALLPIYTFNVNYGGKKYSFAMNGQTGKVVGELPTDKKKKLLYRWGSFAAIFAALMLFLHFVSC